MGECFLRDKPHVLRAAMTARRCMCVCVCVCVCVCEREREKERDRERERETQSSVLTLRLLMSYIYGAPSKARNANVVYIWTYVWQR